MRDPLLEGVALRLQHAAGCGDGGGGGGGDVGSGLRTGLNEGWTGWRGDGEDGDDSMIRRLECAWRAGRHRGAMIGGLWRAAPLGRHRRGRVSSSRAGARVDAPLEARVASFVSVCRSRF